jgi:hypothetical protein
MVRSARVAGGSFMRNRVGRIGVLAAALVAAAGAAAQPAPSDPPAEYAPPTTEWGDPDLRGTWPLERIAEARIPLERPRDLGERALATEEEFARRLEAAARSDGAVSQGIDMNGTTGLAEWLRSTPFARRTSLIVDPADGRLPPMTERASALFAAGRNSWNEGHPIDWVTDLDSYDRCITRGVPSAILPWPNNNGVRVFQSPGFVVLQLEVLGTRIIPVGHGERWPEAVRSWSGRSIGHWEGSTLVIETDAIVAGDSASTDVARRAGSPVTGRIGGLVPMSEQARTVERLTMTGPSTIAYEVTYSDPEVYTAPWTAKVEWTRDHAYRLYEYACHEGNQTREMITGSRAQRGLVTSAARGTGNEQQDGTGRWPFPEPAAKREEQTP